MATMSEALAQALGKCEVCGAQAVTVRRGSKPSGIGRVIRDGQEKEPFVTHELTLEAHRYCEACAPEEDK